jgi:tetratricopeptide (TPR) repeat protein
MTDHAKGTHRISDYLTLVSRREDPVTAAEKAFGDLKDLQAALDDYIRLNGYREFVLNSAAAPLDEASYKSTPLTEAQADAIRADFLVYVQRIQDARTLLDAVLKSDPDNAKAHETMGYLAFRDGDREGARKWYEQAVKLDPRSPLAHYYAALLSMNGGVSPDYPEIEANLRAAIGLSPRFAPAYDQLASLFAMEHKNLDEAHMLNLQAVQLEPNSLAYRMNTATVLVTMGRYSDAVAVLRVSLGVAKGPSEVLMVQRRVKQVEAIEALGAQPNATVTTPPTAEVDIQTAEKVVDVVPEPKHPTEPADGPRHSADGTIREVQCRDPAEIAFLVETGKKPVLLYSNNFFKVDFTVVGFTPKGDLNPCKDIEGLKARVQYAESSDKTVDGQVISIELRK